MSAVLELSRSNLAPKASSRGEGYQSVYKGYLDHTLKQCRTWHDPLIPRTGHLEREVCKTGICEWPNINHKISFDTILELSGITQQQKLAQGARDAQVFIKTMLVISLSNVGPNRV